MPAKHVAFQDGDRTGVGRTAAMILACDAGGTKTNVALFDVQPDGLRMVVLERYASRDHVSLGEIIRIFIDAHPAPLEAAGFGVPGPVLAEQVDATNLPWTIDGSRLARTLGLARISLLNDTEAQAWSIPRLRASDQLTVQTGANVSGNMAVISARTGLG